jgi:hypothetical protein
VRGNPATQTLVISATHCRDTVMAPIRKTYPSTSEEEGLDSNGYGR